MTDLLSLRPAMKFLTDGALSSPMPKAPGSPGSLVNDVYSSFQQVLGEVNRMQFNAEDQARAFAAGDVEDVHDVALAINKAKFALDLTVRIRDRLLDAYRELSQMR